MSDSISNRDKVLAVDRKHKQLSTGNLHKLNALKAKVIKGQIEDEDQIDLDYLYDLVSAPK
jgi:hypothetical protein